MEALSPRGECVAFFVVFLAYPLIRSFYISLHSWPGFGPEKWVGLRNFSAMFKDQVWRQSLENTLIFAAATTVITTAAAMVVAAVLKAGWPFGVVFRVAIFVPGLQSLSVSWLSNGHTVLPSIIVVSIWQSVGFFMLIFCAGLQDIDPELYEAARIDGASVISQFRHVIVPMLRTVTSIVVTLNLINGLKTFDVIYVMTGGGPDHASDSLTTYLYSLAIGARRRLTS